MLLLSVIPWPGPSVFKISCPRDRASVVRRIVHKVREHRGELIKSPRLHSWWGQYRRFGNSRLRRGKLNVNARISRDPYSLRSQNEGENSGDFVLNNIRQTLLLNNVEAWGEMRRGWVGAMSQVISGFQRWMPILKKYQVELPLECPFHESRDIFRPQQKAKHQHRSSQWTCGLCGKSFYAEKHLDAHFDNRHKSNVNTVGIPLFPNFGNDG